MEIEDAGNLEERVFAVAYENALKDSEYKKLQNEAIYLGEKIMRRLGPDSYLFLKYQEATCLAKGIRLKGAYRLGLEDSPKSPT